MNPRSLTFTGFVLPYGAIAACTIYAQITHQTYKNTSPFFAFVVLGVPVIATVSGLVMICIAKSIRARDLPRRQRVNSMIFTVIWSTLLQVTLAIVVVMQVIYGSLGITAH